MSALAIALAGLLLAAWTFGAGWLALTARGKMRQAETHRRAARRMQRIIDESPAIPMLVRADGRIEAPVRLASWLGLSKVPGYLSELDDGESGIESGQMSELKDLVRRAQKTANPFHMVIKPRGSERTLALRGHLADPLVSPGGAAMVWFFDFSESESELNELRAQTARARDDFAALVGLIEAAPMPMWFRGADTKLRLVNSAYVAAVGASDAQQVVDQQIELVEAHDGLTAAQIAGQALAQNRPVERHVTATIDGQRRTLNVSDLPLGEEGIAGYGIDIEELEEQVRAFRAFREAQRSMLDQLSIGVAQFDSSQIMTFANQPFQRIFAMGPAALVNPPTFEAWLGAARDGGSLPEVRDFPTWRSEHAAWFSASTSQEEAWPLPDGRHLRVVAQPMPDGGLVLIAEDRTEQLELSATRDTLLRTRTATFDSLFEALGVFAPDGRMQLWNRRFASVWGLEDAFLDQHPRIDALLEKISHRLARPAQSKGIGDVVRIATLDRKQRGGRLTLDDGRTLEFAGVPLPDGNSLLIVLDITDSQKAEDALRERNAALEEADAVKTRFLANMSYEFRTPLTSIGGFAELLQAGVAGDLSAEAKEYIDGILASVDRLSEQIESVLDLSQSEAGLLPIAAEPIELMPFMTRLVRDREERIVAGKLHLELRGDKSAGIVNGDARRLGRAVGHIIDNAIAATPRNGKILVELVRRKGGARITISDNGPGMDAATVARALDDYGDTGSGEKVERRSGLGLPLARRLIEAHGGKLELVSQKGAGTTVTINLP